MRYLNDRLDEHRGRKGGPLALSLLIHGLALIAMIGVSSMAVEVAESAGGLLLSFDEPGGGGGGGGGDAIAAPVEEAPAADDQPAVEEAVVPEELIPVPIIVEVPDLMRAVLDSVNQADQAAAVAAMMAAVTSGVGSGAGGGQGPGSGGGLGGGSGGGVGTGIGTGRGPGTGAGNGLLIGVPIARGLVIPPPAPGNVRGKSIRLTLTVDSTGVVREVELDPKSGNGDFDKLLRNTAMKWLFRPGTDQNRRPITSLFVVVFKF